MNDTVSTVAANGPTWAAVALEIWRDIRGEVITGAIAFLAGWLGLKRPRFKGKRTRATDPKV